MHCPVRQAEPGMHRLLPDRIARRREGGDIERADRDPTHRRVAVAFPVQVAAAIRAEIKADPIAAVGAALVDLALAFEPHLLFRVARAEMEGGAGAPPARLAMAEIDALRLARRDYFERSAMAFGRPFHCCLRADCWCGAFCRCSAGARLSDWRYADLPVRH